MPIIFSKKSKEIHLFNTEISYIIQIYTNGQLGNLYYGKQIRHKDDFTYLMEGRQRSLAVYTKVNDYFFSPQYSRMEYPCTGTGDFREPAFEIKQKNGSKITNFSYLTHEIYKGKKELDKLPSVYVEKEDEADTIEITLRDDLLKVDCILTYTIFSDYPAIGRNVKFINHGEENIFLERAFSASIDFPDADFEMIQLSGEWARERKTIKRKLAQGTQGINSRRGISSAEQNPFLAIKRLQADENQGEVYGFSLVYSGNHFEQAEVDTCDVTRIQIGIHPENFEWKLETGEVFQTPEAILVYSDKGLNGMSQTYHKLYRSRLVRGIWRDKERPILINNWEATGVDFTQKQILAIAKTGKELGMELFVLDDGWFGKRNDDKSGLGDWYVTNYEKLPGGIDGLAKKINDLGMKFGLWFEPEMLNMDSDLYHNHPDWILCAPGRTPSPSRNQYVLDFSRQEVVNYIYKMMEKILIEAPIEYIKWDMNRYLTECYSVTESADNQGKVMHNYILGVYSLYEKLINRFPEVLFESCSSGGARFDPGMLYYAPQTWTSDDTDAMERVKIQYGTSYLYPLCTMGAHISEVPNHQVGRITPFKTRGNVAMFGQLGYELDLNKITTEEKQIVKEQIAFFKLHRKLIMEGTFFRLMSPFENNDSAWVVVSQDKTEAIMGFYRMFGIPNDGWIRIKLAGLDSQKNYIVDEKEEVLYGGDELMHVGMVIKKEELVNQGGDYSSKIFIMKEAASIGR